MNNTQTSYMQSGFSSNRHMSRRDRENKLKMTALAVAGAVSLGLLGVTTYLGHRWTDKSAVENQYAQTRMSVENNSIDITQLKLDDVGLTGRVNNLEALTNYNQGEIGALFDFDKESLKNRHMKDGVSYDVTASDRDAYTLANLFFDTENTSLSTKENPYGFKVGGWELISNGNCGPLEAKLLGTNSGINEQQMGNCVVSVEKNKEKIGYFTVDKIKSCQGNCD